MHVFNIFAIIGGCYSVSTINFYLLAFILCFLICSIENEEIFTLPIIFLYIYALYVNNLLLFDLNMGYVNLYLTIGIFWGIFKLNLGISNIPRFASWVCYWPLNIIFTFCNKKNIFKKL